MEAKSSFLRSNAFHLALGGAVAAFIGGGLVFHQFREASVLNSQASTLRREAEGIQTSLRRPATTASTGTGLATLTGWRLLYLLQREHMIRVATQFADYGSGKLNPGFIQLLEMTEAEQAQLQAALDRARRALANLEGPRASLMSHQHDAWAGGDTWVVQVAPFADAGERVRIELLQSFADTLGPERNAIFLELANETIEGSFDGFGFSPPRISFARYGPHTNIFGGVEVEYADPRGNGREVNRFGTLDAVVSRFGPVTQVLPPEYFQPKSDQ